jgi:heme-degrading monooxygenase HmoA
MIIVSGHLVVQPGTRDDYVDSCLGVVQRARTTPGCVDFALSPDPLEPDRVNVLEVWTDRDRLHAFRGAGIGEEQGALLVSVAVAEYDAGPTSPAAASGG